MTQINWNQFKVFKQEYSNRMGFDNFQLLLEFIRSVDNLISPDEMLDILMDDELSRQMVEKRGISDVIQLEEHLYQQYRR
ncbi:MAG: hypothetical protein M0P91_05500 [Sulfuricurvum sp.]|uniref:hypothetical protein n=1 Tax=Sulfuricurvum sp. TaxID=2025608 RepID=UPI0025D9CE65|nr:hypothetical protein [Sulfuricurvum sp.]MCK9372632.1 hypothetical protein [Sulfuricurvum sp.]